ncbi:uracil phosphoribosyltransferase [Millisia brevis]|uniref:uracil phosphoribosyltransferase n=1 Tax=Millisia brevis TaxID=264148 RepID=UPI000B127B95|nr:uracil phosphoribosyltransferase [Millisia brevis]
MRSQLSEISNGTNGFDPRRDRRVIELPRTAALLDAHTRMRDHTASRENFVTHSRRVFRALLEAAVCELPFESIDVRTPPGHTFRGVRPTCSVCAVAVVRAGESIESEVWSILPGARIGKILIQRDRATSQPHLYYSHLPPRIGDGHVLLLEPMLATGGSLLTALDVLRAAGVTDDRVVVVNVLASPSGLRRVVERHPDLRIVTSSIEESLDINNFMIPGIGDFGDRYFGTDGHPR